MEGGELKPHVEMKVKVYRASTDKWYDAEELEPKWYQRVKVLTAVTELFAKVGVRRRAEK